TKEQKNKTIEPRKKKESTKEAPTDEAGSNTDTAACIDINDASEAELTGIKHIGDKRAVDLIEERPFDSLDDLSRVDGIAEGRLKEIKAEGKACLGGE